MKGTSNYVRFALWRYVWCFIRHPYVLPKLCANLFTCTGYMSTRIAPNKAMGWTYEDNIVLSRRRADDLRAHGEKPLNPTTFNEFIGKTWSPMEYMAFWATGVALAALLGKRMFCFQEDLDGGSRGCAKEKDIAQFFQMPINTYPSSTQRNETSLLTAGSKI